MSAARFRPEMRMPWYAAVAIYAVTYLAWAGLNGWDFRPTPFWIVVAIVLGSLYGSRAWLVKEIAKDEAEEAELAGEADGPQADATAEPDDGAKGESGESAADDAPR